MRRAGGVLALLLLASCGDETPAASAPSPAALPSAPAAPSPAQLLAGEWCERSRTAPGSDTPVMDGTLWTFEKDGRYRKELEDTTSGTWQAAAGKLTLSPLGEHEIVELSAERVVLRSMGVSHNLMRGCGEIVDKARKVSALRKAAAKGDYLMAKALIDKGVSVDAADAFDSKLRTPLLSAIEGGHAEVVKLLLARGANRLASDEAGDDALTYAEKKHPELTPLLIDGLADSLKRRADERAERAAKNGELDPSQLDPSALSGSGTGNDRSGGGDRRSAAKKAYDTDFIELTKNAANDPKYDGPEGEKRFEQDTKQLFCLAAEEAIAQARAGNNGRHADNLGISKAEHLRILEQNYDRDCR